MSTRTDEKLPPIREVSHEEAREIFDEQTRKYLGMSGEEFVRRFFAGEFSDDDLDCNPDIVMLAMLMPVDRQRE